MKDKQQTTSPSISTQKLQKRRKVVETIASVGILLVLAGMFLPLMSLVDDTGTLRLSIYKWIFTAGAVMFWGARCVNTSDNSESMRIRRLKRMEFWAGACFGVAAFFWFYNEHKYVGNPTIGQLTILNDTIMFALAGAVIQIVSVWMVYFRQKKEAKETNS